MQLRINGNKNEFIELLLPNLKPYLNKNKLFDIELQLKIQSGSWTSTYFSQFVRLEGLISFLNALKAVAEFSHDEAQLQEPDDLLFARVALSKDKKEIFVHGHAKELNHKNELNFSFESSPTLISALAKQIDSLNLVKY